VSTRELYGTFNKQKAFVKSAHDFMDYSTCIMYIAKFTSVDSKILKTIRGQKYDSFQDSTMTKV